MHIWVVAVSRYFCVGDALQYTSKVVSSNKALCRIKGPYLWGLEKITNNYKYFWGNGGFTGEWFWNVSVCKCLKF